jgi:hypothetical protein
MAGIVQSCAAPRRPDVHRLPRLDLHHDARRLFLGGDRLLLGGGDLGRRHASADYGHGKQNQ